VKAPSIRKKAAAKRPGGKDSGTPLAGMRILVGRARHQAGTLSSQVRELGGEVIEIPFIEIRKPRSFKPLDDALRNIAAYDWLIVTSANGVDAVWERMRKLRMESRSLGHLKIAAIGPATKKSVEKLGARVNVVPREYIAESVVSSLRKKVPGQRILLARAKVARDVIPRELRKLGAKLDVVEAYETVIPKASRARLRRALGDPRRRLDIITFTSSSTVRNFAALGGTLKWQVESRPRFASIGPVTSATLRELGIPVDIQARAYTIPGLVDAIAKYAASRRSDHDDALQ
jgi:uroporphyrinogen-III synthase